jgi:hypothetical protein
VAASYTGNLFNNLIQDSNLKKLGWVERVEYDTGPRNLRGPCTPQTRERILDDLMAWATNDSARPVYWLAGMAGTGKTTIAYSLCERLREAGLLCASFFCTRTLDPTREPRAIIPTIAYQIATRLNDFSSALVETLQNPDNNEVRNKGIGSQFTTLILGPAKAVSFAGLKRLLVVWDGFDEANKQSRGTGSDEIGQLLSLCLTHSTVLPFKFFISSRLEQEIKASFRFDGDGLHDSLLLHDIEENIVAEDIRRYIHERLDAITRRRWKERSQWISNDEIGQLVVRSGKLFVYASALCTFLGQGTAAEVETRLEHVLRGHPTQDISGVEDTPHGRLDDLYLKILDAASGDDALSSILHLLVAAKSHLSIDSISSLLQIKAFRTEKIVLHLHSVLTIADDSSHTSPISIFHASFRDFLIDEGRSKCHFLKVQESHHLLARCCLELMERTLTVNNICDIVSKDTPRSDISPSTIQKAIPFTLEYACTSWLFHVMELNAELVRSLEDSIIAFFDHCILRWIECMAWLGRLEDAVTLLRALEVSQAVCYSYDLLYITH